MIKFLIKGLLRDKYRSRLPLIVVAIGVMLTVLMTTWITGIFGDSITLSAKLMSDGVRLCRYFINSKQAILQVKNIILG